MHRRTAATRLVTLITLGALAATLVGTVTVQARESRSTDRQLRIKADPARETAGLRTFRKVDVANLPERTTPRQLDALQELGLGSALVVPLRARDRVIGVLCLVHESVDGFPRAVVDTAAQDIGTLNSWALEVSTR